MSRTMGSGVGLKFMQIAAQTMQRREPRPVFFTILIIYGFSRRQLKPSVKCVKNWDKSVKHSVVLEVGKTLHVYMSK